MSKGGDHQLHRLVTAVLVVACWGSTWQSRAGIFKTVSARFCGQHQPLTVTFEQQSWWQAKAVVRSPEGEEVAAATFDNEPKTLASFLPGTGVYDVTGDNCPELVLYAQIAGKVTQLQVYSLTDRKLRLLLRWQGFSFTLVQLGGMPVLALKNYEVHGLTNLFSWRHGKFHMVNKQFPEFYASEIADAKSFLEGSKYFGAGTSAQACRMAAQGLVYGKHYDEAEQVCRKAYQTVDSHLDDPPDGEDRDLRLKAERKVQQALQSIAHARREGSRELNIPAS